MRYSRLRVQMDLVTPTTRKRKPATVSQNGKRGDVDGPRQESMPEVERATMTAGEDIFQLDARAGKEVTMDTEAFQNHVPSLIGSSVDQYSSAATRRYDPDNLGGFQNSSNLERPQHPETLERFPPMFIDPRLRSYTSRSTPNNDEHLSYPSTPEFLVMSLQGTPPSSIPSP